MEVVKASEGIAATIELLESIPVRGRDLELIGLALLQAIKNLKLINQAIIEAENETDANDVQLDIAPMDKLDEDGDRA